jgi:hypothetical protein
MAVDALILGTIAETCWKKQMQRYEVLPLRSIWLILYGSSYQRRERWNNL